MRGDSVDSTDSLARDGAIAIAFFALLGIALAVGTSAAGCGTTDGSFSLDDAGARPSGFCELTHFPGMPDSAASALVVGGMYLGPAVIVGVGVVASARTSRMSLFQHSVMAAGFLTIAALFVSLALAQVGYQGV